MQNWNVAAPDGFDARINEIGYWEWEKVDVEVGLKLQGFKMLLTLLVTKFQLSLTKNFKKVNQSSEEEAF